MPHKQLGNAPRWLPQINPRIEHCVATPAPYPLIFEKIVNRREEGLGFAAIAAHTRRYRLPGATGWQRA
jgi:hypothetical protein